MFSVRGAQTKWVTGKYYYKCVSGCYIHNKMVYSVQVIIFLIIIYFSESLKILQIRDLAQTSKCGGCEEISSDLETSYLFHIIHIMFVCECLSAYGCVVCVYQWYRFTYNLMFLPNCILYRDRTHETRDSYIYIQDFLCIPCGNVLIG